MLKSLRCLCLVSCAVVVARAQTAAPLPLSLSPVLLRFTSAAGSNPAALSVTLAGSGATAPWTAAASASWLALSPASGTGPSVITVTPQTAAMLPGFYSATVQVTAPGAAASIPVTLSISALPGTPIVTGNQWFVSLSGSPAGDGSMANPWDIATGLNNQTVQPGDTVWLRAGHYGGGTAASILTSSLVGTPAAPIIVRAFPGDRVVIDAWLQAGCCDQANNPALGSYTWFWGLEFAGYNTNRVSTTNGSQLNHAGADTWGDGTRFINCILHDTAGGISIWDAKNAAAYGNILYNIGGYGPAGDRGHGHDFYLQNTAPSVLAVSDNIGFNNFDEGLQAFGSTTAFVQNITLAGNVIFNSGLLYGTLVDNFTIGGGGASGGADGIVVDGNYTYDTPSLNQGQNELGYLWDVAEGGAVVTNNYFIGGFQAVDLERWNTLAFQNNTMYTAPGSQQSWLIYNSSQNPATYSYGNNTYYGADLFWTFASCPSPASAVVWPCPNSYVVGDWTQWQSATGVDAGSTFDSGAPGGTWTFVRPNLYEPGRANIVIYNWGLLPAVAVDLTSSGIQPGDPFQIRDAENWFAGPVVSGTYTGAPVTVPMSGLQVAQPVGSVPSTPAHTAPQFGAFVLLSGNAYPKSPISAPPPVRRH